MTGIEPLLWFAGTIAVNLLAGVALSQFMNR
jgi:hypothetical protein